MKYKLPIWGLCLWFAAMTLLPMRAAACVNGDFPAYENGVRGSVVAYPLPLGFHVDPNDARIQRDLPYWRTGFEGAQSFSYANNYGLYLLFADSLEASEAQFRKVVEVWPNEYSAAANLGTILEVNGKYEEALHWIKRSVEINPEAHQGSEWIHVKILEAKVNGLPIEGKSLFGLDFGTELVPKTTLDRRGVAHLQKQLFYQLNERISFISPPDPFIALLMYELGNATYLTGPGRSAVKIYKLAEEYGCKDPLLRQRMKILKARY